MTTTELAETKQTKYDLKNVFDKAYGRLYVIPEKHIMICEANREYLTIEEFKEIFNATKPLIDQYNVDKFIFDKQNMRVFHQPSMEWYYVHWKKEMFAKGLKTHRKILPQNQPQFNIAVEAGKAKIMNEYSDLIIDKLDIQYRKSVEEAIED
ncbi:hypothetical protein [Salinivirga cyanobacteriivorans]|uniref:Uncharacterized protein n=1 Tax=Salinivirga cyanobacteriivorans TaxID=1307839 RepID=A0A0S2HWR6_9BACT|nr:hypothetical protein [Salinivirga cyanobacteriivorans]ALO14528.1 hypothetical protein L21SP5_00858 [Salinivirga cyanobacteriivorans]